MNISMMDTLSWCLLFFSHFLFTLYMKADNSMVQMMLSQGEMTIFLGALTCKTVWFTRVPIMDEYTLGSNPRYNPLQPSNFLM